MIIIKKDDIYERVKVIFLIIFFHLRVLNNLKDSNISLAYQDHDYHNREEHPISDLLIDHYVLIVGHMTIIIKLFCLMFVLI